MAGTVPRGYRSNRYRRRTVTDVTDRPGPTPGSLRWAVRLVTAEAVAVTLVFGYVVYLTARATGTVPAEHAVLVVGFAAVMAGLLWLFGWALSRRQGWARGPAVVLELMLLPIGYFMVAAGLLWAGIPICALGLVGAGLLVAPTTREALGVK
jgi:hypothetical protein